MINISLAFQNTGRKQMSSFVLLTEDDRQKSRRVEKAWFYTDMKCFFRPPSLPIFYINSSTLSEVQRCAVSLILCFKCFLHFSQAPLKDSHIMPFFRSPNRFVAQITGCPHKTDAQCLGCFDHAHQSWSEGASMQLVANFGDRGNCAWLLAWDWRMEKSFVLVGVKLLAIWVDLDQAVFGEHLLHLAIGHHQPVVKVLQVGVLWGHRLLGHALRCLFQNVCHL